MHITQPTYLLWSFLKTFSQLIFQGNVWWSVQKFACGCLLSGQRIILQWGSRGVLCGKSNSKDEIIVWEMTLLVWSTDIAGRLGLWPEDKQRRPGVGSRTTWLYHNYYYDSSYKYGHPMSVMEKVAVHIHALNKKSRQWSPSYCNHSTKWLGPYNSYKIVTLKGECSYPFTKNCP